MARPRKTGVDYFPVDTKFDDEIEMLQAAHGNDGFAVWFFTVQALYRAEGAEIEYSDVLRRRVLAKAAHVTQDCFEEIIVTAASPSLKLFTLEERDGKTFLSSRGVTKRVEEIHQEREKGRNRKRNKGEEFSGGKPTENEVQTQGFTPSKTDVSPPERKEKEKKEKNNTPPTPPQAGGEPAGEEKPKRKRRTPANDALPSVEDLTFPPVIDNPEVREAFARWIEVRAKHPRPVTTWLEFFQGQLADLAQYGVEGALLSLRHSTTNQYRGLFAPRWPAGKLTYGEGDLLDDAAVRQLHAQDPEAYRKRTPVEKDGKRFWITKGAGVPVGYREVVVR